MTWMTVKQVQEYLDLPTRGAVYYHVRCGRLRAYKMGQLLRFRKEEIDAYLSSHPVIDTELYCDTSHSPAMKKGENGV